MPGFAEHIRSSLTQLAAGGADARRIAVTAIAVWRQIDAALSPIIGWRGMAALFRRSLASSGIAQTLAAAQDDTETPGDFEALRATLEQLSTDAAIATNGALLQKFVDLLTNLIGESLTERLLQSVQDNPPRHGAVQEISS